jgi:hypothetical protein
MLRVHILTRWGAVKLADVTREQIAGWIAELRCSGLSASTVRQIHRVFSLVLALACVTGASRAIRQRACRSRVPREGSRCSSRTIGSMHWPMRRDASGS